MIFVLLKLNDHLVLSNPLFNLLISDMIKSRSCCKSSPAQNNISVIWK